MSAIAPDTTSFPRGGLTRLGGPWRRPSGDGILALFMILPAAILVGLFYVWPFVNGFWLSLHNWDGFSAPSWAGLAWVTVS